MARRNGETRNTKVTPSAIADEELRSATGGLVVISQIAILIGLLVPDAPKKR